MILNSRVFCRILKEHEVTSDADVFTDALWPRTVLSLDVMFVQTLKDIQGPMTARLSASEHLIVCVCDVCLR